MHRVLLFLMIPMFVGGLQANEPKSRSMVIFPEMGVGGKVTLAASVKEAGGDFLTLGTQDFLCPHMAEEVFERNLAVLRESGGRLLACNGFLRSAEHVCVGPEVKTDAILAWSEIAFRRLAKAGGKFIVFGSAGSRRIPDQWTKEQANEQFVTLLKQLGPLAQKHGITVVVEQLRKEECNFLNHIDHLADLIHKAGHPHVRALADLYHMRSVGENAEDLKRNLDVIVHIEIAELEGRTYPGIHGDDFTPFFRVLADAGWQGAINIEGRGEAKDLKAAFETIRRQESVACDRKSP